MKSIRYAVLFWLGVTGLVLMSLIPNVSLPGWTIDVGVTVRVSNELLAHLLGCALLAWLYVKAYGLSVKGVVFMLLLAVASEVVQFLFTENRNIEIGDLAANIVGVVAGMSIEGIGKFIKGVRVRKGVG